MNDCKYVMDRVKEVKGQIHPCEIRIKKVNKEYRGDLRHPFYTIPIYLREMALIGSTQEIAEAEKILEKFFQVYRETFKINTQQMSYLLPF
jgi:hypothetical protein